MVRKSSPENAAPKVADFEHALEELETLVARMENGDMTLEEALSAYERGVKLYRQCQGALEAAELRVRQLGEPQAAATGEPLEPEA